MRRMGPEAVDELLHFFSSFENLVDAHEHRITGMGAEIPTIFTIQKYKLHGEIISENKRARFLPIQEVLLNQHGVNIACGFGTLKLLTIEQLFLDFLDWLSMGIDHNYYRYSIPGRPMD